MNCGEGALTKHPETVKYRRPRLFVMTLRYSRRNFRKVVWKSSAEIWARLYEEAVTRLDAQGGDDSGAGSRLTQAHELIRPTDD